MKPQHLTRRQFIGVAGAAAAAAATIGCPAHVRPRPKTRSVIVLGIDGMDPRLLSRYLAEGHMPNCRRLAEMGTFMPLRTSDPPQSPVAWSNFISGTNPGGHGIYDFIAREPATLRPYFSLARVEPSSHTLRFGDTMLPLTGPQVVNLRKGPTFWRDLEEHGVDCTLIRIPANFPPTHTGARALSGLGTPDILGGYGMFTFFTTDLAQATREVPGGAIRRVEVVDGRVKCVMPGPVNDMDRQRRPVDLPFVVFLDPANPAAKVAIQGREVILKAGEWSDWVTVRFPLLGRVAGVSGICRFYLKRASGPFGLYVSPVNIDPMDPSLPISEPADYARQVARESGLFHTQSLAQDTHALSSGIFSDDEYRTQSTYVLDEELRLFERAIRQFNSGFLFFYFSSLDLNSHAFWRTIDAGHPLHTPELATRHGDFLPWLYGRMDEAVGLAIKRVGPDTTLMVVSDHGFTSFRRQFNLNTWLMDSGYSKARGASRGDAPYFGDADWTGTQAYGLGINALYLNVRGREPQGIIEPGEADALARRIAAQLLAVRDPATDDPVVSRVLRPAEIYSGPHVGDAPDLIVGYAPGYRASWDTVLGKYPAEVFLDNLDPWSGDHAVDSQTVPGVLLSNIEVTAESPGLEDMAPTILKAFGVPAPTGMTGRPIA